MFDSPNSYFYISFHFDFYFEKFFYYYYYCKFWFWVILELWQHYDFVCSYCQTLSFIFYEISLNTSNSFLIFSISEFLEDRRVDRHAVKIFQRLLFFLWFILYLVLTFFWYDDVLRFCLACIFTSYFPTVLNGEFCWTSLFWSIMTVI